jgi:two-component system response regulator QseB
METLLRAYPRVVTRGVLEDSILRRDHAAEHRSSKSVEVHLSNLRKKLGRGVVETVHGEGYRCSKTFHAQHGERPA